MTVVETLLTDVPIGWWVTDVYVGANWVLSVAQNRDGLQRAGVAAAPHEITPDARYPLGHHTLNVSAEVVAQGLRSADMTAAAVGLATLNALHQPEDSLLSRADAADWLSARCRRRNLAVFGRFPFIDAELRPFAQHVWVFEQQPQPGEFDSTSIAEIVPQADVVAITGSAVINHTLDLILPHASPASLRVLLGPSTPLSTMLLENGIDALFGVRVIDMQAAIESLTAGEGFQKMRGLQRVALLRPGV